MGVLDKLLDVVKLNDEYEEDDFLDEGLLDEDDEDFLDDEDDEEKPVKKFFQKFGKKKEENDFFDEDEDFQRALETLEKKRVPDVRPQEKLTRFLVSRGFSYQVARAATSVRLEGESAS